MAGLILCSLLGFFCGAVVWGSGAGVLAAVVTWLVAGQVLFAGFCWHCYRRNRPQSDQGNPDMVAELSALGEYDATRG